MLCIYFCILLYLSVHGLAVYLHIKNTNIESRKCQQILASGQDIGLVVLRNHLGFDGCEAWSARRHGRQGGMVWGGGVMARRHTNTCSHLTPL